VELLLDDGDAGDIITPYPASVPKSGGIRNGLESPLDVGIEKKTF
jgi:hypothetical protein